MRGEGLILVATDISPELEDEFNRWYDEQHIPERLAVPGFLGARRFRAVEGEPKYLALYELEDVSVLKSPEYLRLGAEEDAHSRAIVANFRNNSRGVYRRLLSLPEPEPSNLPTPPFTIVRGTNVAPEHEEEFVDWYGTEHIPNLMRVPGVLRGRNYRLDTDAAGTRGNPATFLAIYDWEQLGLQSTPEWKQAVDTPWAARIRALRTNLFRNVCVPVSG